MRLNFTFFPILFVACWISPLAAQSRPMATANEIRLVSFAERVIFVELVRSLSRSVRSEREKCLMACPGSSCFGTGASELAIASMGVNRSDAAADALIDLLGFRLDGADSEERSCQIFIRRAESSRRLKDMQAGQVVRHCQALFLDMRKRELADIPDVTIDQACRSEPEILADRDEWLHAFESQDENVMADCF
jgi:hypothetical protein